MVEAIVQDAKDFCDSFNLDYTKIFNLLIEASKTTKHASVYVEAGFYVGNRIDVSISKNTGVTEIHLKIKLDALEHYSRHSPLDINRIFISHINTKLQEAGFVTELSLGVLVFLSPCIYYVNA